jgi:two-component system, sensor histidine kinase and response regulator
MKVGGNVPAAILIVDDTPANLLVLETVLAPLDRKIVRAASGEAALRECLNTEFAVILLDVKMAGLDGFQTASLIRGRAKTREVPIIFITAYDAELQEARRAYGLGAVDYLPKPFDVEILRYKVAAFIRLYEQEEELRRLADELRQRERFIGVLGHDLRNPLASIHMATSLLTRAPDLAPRHRDHVQRVVRATKRMDALVSDMLDLTRGQLAGGIPVRPEPTDLAAVCKEIVDEMRAVHPDREIVLSTDGNCVGSWDPARLTQALSNLIGNALQHCKANPIRVSLQASGERVTLSVSNPGLIPKETRERLFQPFQRGSGASPGLGLGLYIVREIVKSHGGKIEVQSDAENRETTFVVVWPRRESQPQC